MGDILKQLRHELQAAGVAPTTILVVEHRLQVWGGGEKHYLRLRDEESRETIRVLVRNGIKPRTARAKVNGR